MICHGESFLTEEKHKGFGKVKMNGQMVDHIEMIGKVSEDFWLVEDENEKLSKGVFKKAEDKKQGA